MTNATITSIAKYIKFRDPVSRKAFHTRGTESKTNPSDQQKAFHPTRIDRYLKSSGTDPRVEARLSRQNRMAQMARNSQEAMRQIGSHLNRMKDTLKTMVHHSPPYPPGSEQRIAVLKKVDTLRKQIEQLTFPSPKDHNMIPAKDGESKNALAGITENGTLDQWLPELNENADDHEITSAIVLLRRTDDFIRHQRDHLKSDTFAQYQGTESSLDKGSAESTSLFIGKHLSRHPDTDLTTASGILKEYLN